MPKLPTGEVRSTAEGFVAVVRLDKGRKTFVLPTARNEDEADARSTIVARLAYRFRKAKVLDNPLAEQLLNEAASAETPAMLEGVEIVAGELCGDQLEAAKVSGPTFESVARDWLSGKLHKSFPDHVRVVSERYADSTLKRLESIFPVIGSKPVSRLTRADCDAAMRQLPVPKGKTELLRETRRQYAVAISRTLSLAELAGYIPRNPLPRGWLPKAGGRKRFPIYYPSEDRALLGHTLAPLGMRMACGAAHREGSRREELLALRVRQLDLENETLALDVNKTDHSRFWRLDPGTAEALRRYLRLRGDVRPDDLVFVDDSGAAIDPDHLSDKVRAWLRAAGVTREDLFTVGPNKGPASFHCFRRSFVTRKLSQGASEDWVRARTGHTTDELLRHRQAARNLAELDLGDVDPLHEAVPELRALGKTDQAVSGNQCHLIATEMVGAAGFEPATLRPPV